MIFTEFITNFKNAFPQYRTTIEDVDLDDLPYLQVREIASIVNRAIKQQNETLVDGLFSFMDDSLKCGDEQLVNIISVSFLEHLSFGKDGRKYLMAMPICLNKQYKLIVEYNESLKSDSELQDFMQKLLDDFDV